MLDRERQQVTARQLLGPDPKPTNTPFPIDPNRQYPIELLRQLDKNSVMVNGTLCGEWPIQTREVDTSALYVMDAEAIFQRATLSDSGGGDLVSDG